MTEYVGFDVSKEETAFCVKDSDGTILARGKVATDPHALFEVLKEQLMESLRFSYFVLELLLISLLQKESPSFQTQKKDNLA